VSSAQNVRNSHSQHFKNMTFYKYDIQFLQLYIISKEFHLQYYINNKS